MDDSPCTGVCRIVDTTGGEPRCISCFRTYEDLDQWVTLSRKARLYRMKQLLEEKNAKSSNKS